MKTSNQYNSRLLLITAVIIAFLPPESSRAVSNLHGRVGHHAPSIASPAPAPPRPARQGIVVHVWYQGYCDPPSAGAGPFCTLPRPYSGSFSIFTKAGNRVASASTDISASFVVLLKPGRYLIIPHDPRLVDEIWEVTVRAGKITEVTLWID